MGGDKAALDRLVPLVQPELHHIARRFMAGERKGHSLQATMLVNEAYMRLVGVQRMTWQSRAHFLAVAATLMRRILVDHARAKNVQKRGGGAARVELPDDLPIAQPGPDILMLHDALKELAKIDPRKSRVVEMKYFSGSTIEEIAVFLKVSPDTVMRDLRLGKAWLLREMRGSGSKSGKSTVRKIKKSASRDE
jgi:RNA polymerase sigma factor (TIGR02999 family)